MASTRPAPRRLLAVTGAACALAVASLLVWGPPVTGAITGAAPGAPVGPAGDLSSLAVGPKLPEVAIRVPATPNDHGASLAGDAPRVTTPGDVYAWQDGNRTLRVVLQGDLVAQKSAANTLDDVVVARLGDESVVERRADHGLDALPAFRSESGGGLMTLPGGVLLALDPAWDPEAVAAFFARNDIAEGQVSHLGFLTNGYLVATEPGFPSLDLANALAGQQGVVAASPNWLRELAER